MKLFYSILTLPLLALSAAIQDRSPAVDESRLTHVHDARATWCGSGYKLHKAVPLPKGTNPSDRLGTLYAYKNGKKGCVYLDNNVGKKQYMYVKICKQGGSSCAKDSGNFGQYAGPVYGSNYASAPVTAKMGSSASKLYIDYKSSSVFK